MSLTKNILVATLVASLLAGFVTGPASAAPKAPDVRPWLLGVSDMPVGWSVYNIGPTARTGCWGPSVTLLGQHPASSGSVTYQDNQDASTQVEMREDLFSWPSGPAARQAWSLSVAGAARCHQFRETSTGPVITVGALTPGDFGDASVAYELTFTVGGMRFGVYYVLVVKGRAVGELYYAGTGAVLNLELKSDVLPLFQKAIGKVTG
jgi:hypothetical protein